MIHSFKFQRKRHYWIFKHYCDRIRFYLNRTIFGGYLFRKDLNDNASIANELLRLTLTSFLLSLLLVVAFEVVEHSLIKIVGYTQQGNLGNIIRKFVSLHALAVAQHETVNSLLTTVASIVGIFIGLYFTAISVVISAMFVRVPSSLRELILKEKAGNLYIKVLSVLTVMCLLLLGYSTFGGQVGAINILIVTFLSCFGVWCFTILGMRTFFFFDPTVLSDSIFDELQDRITKSTIKGFKWNDPSFQVHYQKLTRQSLLTLETLIKLCVTEPQLLRQSLSIVMQKTMYYFSDKYEKMRSLIPTDSRWFALAPKYKNWFLCDSGAITTALESKTGIQPEMKPNSFWIEDRITEIFSATYSELIQRNNTDTIYETMNAFNSYLESLGNDLEICKGASICKDVCVSVKNYFTSNKKEKYPDTELALFDMYGLTIMSLVLGFHKYVRAFSVDTFIKKIDDINWNNDKDIYSKEFPPILLPRVEFLLKRLQFEIQVEGKAVSPKWYIRQLVIKRFIEVINESVDEILRSLEEHFVSLSDELIVKKSFILAAHHSQRGMEICNKVQAHLPRIKKLLEGLDAFMICKDLPFQKMEYTIVDSKIDQISEKLIQNIAKCMPFLSAVAEKDDVPDLFGQSYSFVCQSCYETLMSKKTDKFKTLFPAVFMGAIAAHEKLRGHLKDWQPDTGLVIVLEPLLDIMALSGYAKIYSELYDDPAIWEICKTTWDRYFIAIDDKKGETTEAIKKLLALYEYRTGYVIQVSPRDLLRSNWEIWLNAKLRELGFEEDVMIEYPRHRKTQIRHKSQFIRNLFEGRLGLHLQVVEIFFITYLLTREDAKNIEFKDKWGLGDRLKRQTDYADGEYDVFS